MKTVSRYIFRQVALSTVLVTSLLTLIIWLTQSLRSIDLVVNHGVGLGTLFYLILLLLPDILSIILPIGLFIGLVVVLNRLQHDHELVVFQSLGLSPWQITRPILGVAILTTGILYSISLYFLPMSFQQFRALQFSYQSQYRAALIQEGEFVHLNKVTLFVRERDADGELRGVFIHDGRDVNKPVILTAESGRVYDTPQGPKILLMNGVRQGYDGQNKGVSFLSFKEYIHEIKRPEDFVNDRQKKPSEYYAWELFQDVPGESPAYMHRLRVEGHQRLLMPLFPLLFVLLTISIILRGSYQRLRRMVPYFWSVLSVIGVQLSVIGILQSAFRWPYMAATAYALVFGGLIYFGFKLIQESRR